MKTKLNEYEQQAQDFLKATKTTFKAEYLEHGFHFDGDKEKRAIYKITLSNKKSEYCFNFGQSINDSFKKEMRPQRDVLEVINVYAGLKTVSSNAGVKFNIYKDKGFSLDDEEFQNVTREMELEYFNKISKQNQKLADKFNKGEISRNFMNKKRHGANLESGAFYQCVQNAIKRELDKEVETNGDFVQVKPTEYDVLACLTKYDPETFEDFCSEFGYDTDSRSAEKTYNSVKDEYENICILFDSDQLEQLSEIS